MNKTIYSVLSIITILATIAGILTLMPWTTAKYPNVLGYRSLCPFAPAATFYCFLIAGLVCFFRATFIKDRNRTSGQRFTRHRKHLLSLIVVLILALACTFWYVSVKRQFTNATTAASQDAQ